MSILADLWGLWVALVTLAAVGLMMLWIVGAVEIRKCWHFQRGAFYVLSHRTYIALINHRRNPMLFSERYERARFRTVRVGRWCLHYGKPQEATS